MSDGPPITEPTIEPRAFANAVVEPNPETIVTRVATPLFSFSAVLFLTLLASQAFVLPTLTTFRVGEVDVSVDEAIAYERALRAEVTSLEDARAELVLPYIDETHDALMRAKRRTPSVVDLRHDLETTMRRAIESSGADVRVDAVLYEAAARSVRVRGEIVNDGPSTMAALGAAVEAVKAMPGVADLEPPALTREELPDGGYRSPFRFTFLLQ